MRKLLATLPYARNLLSDEDLALLVAQPDDMLPRQIAEAVNDALEINGGKGKPAPTGLAQ